jgi:hypothetical protein
MVIVFAIHCKAFEYTRVCFLLHNLSKGRALLTDSIHIIAFSLDVSIQLLGRLFDRDTNDFVAKFFEQAEVVGQVENGEATSNFASNQKGCL